MARPLPPAALAEVAVSLGGTLLDVRHIGRGAEASPWSPWLPRYTLGEGPRAQLPVALAGCDARGCFTLVEAAGPAICLRLAPAMLGSVRRGGAELAVAELLARGETTLLLVPGEGVRRSIGMTEGAGVYRPSADCGRRWGTGYRAGP